MVSTTASIRWAPGRPAAGLHGPDPLDLARRPDHGDAGLGRQARSGTGRARPGPWSGCRSCPAASRISLAVVARWATPFHGSLGVVARPGDQRPRRCRRRPAAAISSADTTPPSWASSGSGAGPHRVGVDDRAQPVAGRAAGDLPVGVAGVGPLDRRGGDLVAGRPGQRGRRRPQRLVAQAAAGAEVPAQRAAGAHLDQLGQVGVLVDADGVGRAGGHAGAALDAAAGVDHPGLRARRTRSCRAAPRSR